MYGKKRIVLSKIVGGGDRGRVYQKGGKSSANIGVWYRDRGRYFADLRTPDQEYKLIKVFELGIKRFGNCETQDELRRAISVHRAI